jgi:hypothetical protein
MSYLDSKEPPKREDRLKACITYGGTLCGLAKKNKSCCMNDGEREFTQGSICLLLPGLAMINSLPDNVVILHGAIGCGACAHSQNANVRSGGNARWGKTKDALWISTALNESDVIGGGEIYTLLMPYAKKLYLTIVHENFIGDTFFPDYKSIDWNVIKKQEGVYDKNNQHKSTFLILERK